MASVCFPFASTVGHVKYNSHTCLIALRYADFTRLKLVQGKKEAEIEEEQKRKDAEKMAAIKSGRKIETTNDADITAQFDAQDDEDVVF